VTREPLARRRDLLAAMLDVLVPPSGDFPGAGAVALDHVLAAAAASADLGALIARGLEATEAGPRGSDGFVALGTDERESALRRVETADPEFFEALVRHAYEAYYSHPIVVARLGLDPRPPQPAGHRVEPVALPDLSRVTARGLLYRPAP
jgi:Gluconate 2-dehydrogenase subunit 3